MDLIIFSVGLLLTMIFVGYFDLYDNSCERRVFIFEFAIVGILHAYCIAPLCRHLKTALTLTASFLHVKFCTKNEHTAIWIALEQRKREAASMLALEMDLSNNTETDPASSRCPL